MQTRSVTNVEIIEAYDALRRALAMMALAIASNIPRDKLFVKAPNGDETLQLALPSSFRAMRLPHEVAERLRERVARGDVTTIVPKPEQFTWLVITSAHEEFRCIYGIWVGRPASWRGKVNPATLPRTTIGGGKALTVKEAIAKGIPIPEMKE